MFRNKVLSIFLSGLMLLGIITFTETQANAAGLNSWVQLNGTWYYFNNGTILKNSWVKDSNGWCFVSAFDGSWVQEGWAKDSHGWGYIRNGYWVQHATWAKDSTGWVYIGNDGYLDATVPPKTTNPEGANVSQIYYWNDDVKYMNFQETGLARFRNQGPKKVNLKEEDNLGNIYSNYLTLSIFGREANCFIEYPLNGQFKQFKSKLGILKDFQNDVKAGNVKIYLDDELVYSETLTAGDFLKDINLNLTGKNKIKFYYSDPKTGSFVNSGIGFFDGQFIK
ncbi:MAG: NPCBM/NEW2 domain-containing protein [Solirubrobacterales bacterium]